MQKELKCIVEKVERVERVEKVEKVEKEVNPFYKGRSQIMGWQIPICQ